MAGFWPCLPSFADPRDEYGVLIGHPHIIRGDPARLGGLLAEVDYDLDAAGAVAGAAGAGVICAASGSVLEGD